MSVIELQFRTSIPLCGENDWRIWGFHNFSQQIMIIIIIFEIIFTNHNILKFSPICPNIVPIGSSFHRPIVPSYSKKCQILRTRDDGRWGAFLRSARGGSYFTLNLVQNGLISLIPRPVFVHIFTFPLAARLLIFTPKLSVLKKRVFWPVAQI